MADLVWSDSSPAAGVQSPRDLSDRVIPISSFRSDGASGAPESVGHTERCAFYKSSGVPNTRLNGTNVVSASGGPVADIKNAIPRIRTAVEEMTEVPNGTGGFTRVQTPFTITPYFEVAASGNLKVEADVALDGDLPANYDPSNTRIFFVVTQTPVGIPLAPWGQLGWGKYQNGTEPYRVQAWEHIPFEAPANGASKLIPMEFNFKPTLPLQYYDVVVFLQNYNQAADGTVVNPTVYQTATDKFKENTASFTSNVTSGYFPLTVSFTDLSYVAVGDTIDSITWYLGQAADFTPIAPIEQTNLSVPVSFTYTEDHKGHQTVTQSVKLKGKDTPVTRTISHYISVLDPSEGITGNISGTWGEGGDDRPWEIIGNVKVLKGSKLIIPAGTTLEFPENTGLTVHGEIEINGTKERPVTFTTKGSATSWKGIVVEREPGSSTSEVIPAAVFEFVTFKKAETALRVIFRDVNISDCTFKDNISPAGSSYPPALSFDRVPKSEVVRSVFMNNKNGAITIDNSNMNMRNCLVVNNEGNSSGGFLLKFNCTILMENCTIWNNKYNNTVGGTIFTQSTGNNVKLTMYNTIIAGSPPINSSDTQGKVTLAHSAYLDFRSGETAPLTSPVYTIGPRVLFKEHVEHLDNIFVTRPSATAGFDGTSVPTDWYLTENSEFVDLGRYLEPTAPLDPEDPARPGMALAPARGTTVADLGFWGGGAVQVNLATVKGRAMYKDDKGGNVAVSRPTFTVYLKPDLETVNHTGQGETSGSFEFGLIPEASYTLKLTHNNFYEQVHDINSLTAAGKDLETLFFTPKITTSGTLVYLAKPDSTAPVTGGVPIKVMQIDGTTSTLFTMLTSNTNTGAFSFQAPPGDYVIQIDKDGYEILVMDVEVPITPGTTNALGNIMMTVTEEVRVTVNGLLDYAPDPASPATKLPVENATVNVKTKGGSPTTVAIVNSIETGAFTFRVAAGNYALVVECEGFDKKELDITVPTTSPYVLPTITMVKTPVGETDIVDIPKITALNSNYPNPFNPTTTIAFDMAKPGNVKLEVFNIKGQKVKTLVDEYREAKSYKVVWNGKDDAGNNVGSGIYFYRMHTADYQSTQKMLLVK